MLNPILEKLADDLRKDASLVEGLVFEETPPLEIDLELLSSSNRSELEKKLKDYCNKIPKNTPSIYVICCPDDNLREMLRKSFRKKRPDLKEFALSRDNNQISFEESNCLYVGSCHRVTKIARLKQHLTEVSPATSSLHMSKWVGDSKGFIRIYFLYNEKKIEPKYLQYVEDALSHELKPLFGKKGSNGRS